MVNAGGGGAAALDAWSTRRAIHAGARELNPIVHPFAAFNVLYPAQQATPTAMDYVGLRMMGSRHRWMRRLMVNAANCFHGNLADLRHQECDRCLGLALVLSRPKLTLAVPRFGRALTRTGR